jgi:DNA adenine methylase
MYSASVQAFKVEAKIQPFLKWAGGKRWFIAKYADLLPKSYARYYEPFLGAASVYFYLKPKLATLADSNKELIDAYRGIRAYPTQFVNHLKRHQTKHSKVYYYTIRDSTPKTLAEKAAKFVYLNRTCFNGIYRVNLNGKFNVPIGSKDEVLMASDVFPEVSRLLKQASLAVSDFERIIDQATAGDFVFADPPYTVRHNNNGFVKYNEKLFSWQDQVRLAQALTKARRRGVQIVSTNANHSTLRQLYSAADFVVRQVSRYSSISGDPLHRTKFGEIIIKSKPRT